MGLMKSTAIRVVFTPFSKVSSLVALYSLSDNSPPFLVMLITVVPPKCSVAVFIKNV